MNIRSTTTVATHLLPTTITIMTLGATITGAGATATAGATDSPWDGILGMVGTQATIGAGATLPTTMGIAHSTTLTASDMDTDTVTTHATTHGIHGTTLITPTILMAAMDMVMATDGAAMAVTLEMALTMTFTELEVQVHTTDT